MMSHNPEYIGSEFEKCSREIKQLKLNHLLEYHRLIISDCTKFVQNEAFRTKLQNEVSSILTKQDIPPLYKNNLFETIMKENLTLMTQYELILKVVNDNFNMPEGHYITSPLFTKALAVNPVNYYFAINTYKALFIKEKMAAVREYFQYPKDVLVITSGTPIIFTDKTKQISETFAELLNKIINNHFLNEQINEVPEVVDLYEDDQPEGTLLQGDIDNNNES